MTLQLSRISELQLLKNTRTEKDVLALHLPSQIKTALLSEFRVGDFATKLGEALSIEASPLTVFREIASLHLSQKDKDVLQAKCIAKYLYRLVCFDFCGYERIQRARLGPLAAVNGVREYFLSECEQNIKYCLISTRRILNFDYNYPCCLLCYQPTELQYHPVVTNYLIGRMYDKDRFGCMYDDLFQHKGNSDWHNSKNMFFCPICQDREACHIFIYYNGPLWKCKDTSWMNHRTYQKYLFFQELKKYYFSSPPIKRQEYLQTIDRLNQKYFFSINFFKEQL